MSVAKPELLTTEQLLALPENGKERWLIRGELREKPWLFRTQGHARGAANLVAMLANWNDHQPGSRGEVHVGQAPIRLRHDPDTFVGVDIAFISADTAEANPHVDSFIEAAPILIIEILSPSDAHKEITEKVDAYLQAGVKIIWVADPSFRTITVYRVDAPPQLFNETQTIDAEPHLPGFRAAVSEVFAR